MTGGGDGDLGGGEGDLARSSPILGQYSHSTLSITYHDQYDGDVCRRAG